MSDDGIIVVDSPLEGDYWSVADVDRQVATLIEGVLYYDTVVEEFMPDGQIVWGPRLKLAHMFARFSMIPAMEACSENMRSKMGGGA